METEEREERGSGRSQNVVHTLPRSMASVPRFLTGPLERADPTEGTTQLLVLTPDAESALGIAEAVLRMTGPGGIELLPITSARRTSRLIAGRPILAAAGSPCDVRDLVRGSHLKLDSIKSIVLAWADEILAGDADDIEALEAVMSELPKDAARIVVTSRSEGRVNAFAERYLRRAHRDVPLETEADGIPIPVQYVTVSASSRPVTLRRLFDDMDPPSAVVLVDSDEAENAVTTALRLLGYRDGQSAVRVSRGHIAPSTYAVVFYEPPSSRAALAAAAGASPVAIVALVEPRDIGALRRLSGGDVRPFTLAAPGNAAREREVAIRRELITVIESGLASRDVLALEPLLDRHDGIEIAAAALKLLERERALRQAEPKAPRTMVSGPDARFAEKSTPGGAPGGVPHRGGHGGGAASREGFSRGGPSRGGPSRGGPSRGGPSHGGPSQSPSSGGGAARGGAQGRDGVDRRPPRGGSGRPPRRDR